MDDLISRQAAIEVIDKIFPADPMRNDYTQGITCGAALATEYIKQLPSAQPEQLTDKEKRIVRRGRWELEEEQKHVELIYSCSECGCIAWGNEEISNYCPNCGAKMEE